MNNKLLIHLMVFFLALFLASVAVSDEMKGSLPTKEKIRIIDRLIKTLKNNYVFPNMSESIAKFLQDKVKKGGYRAIDNVSEFASQLTIDIQDVSNDLHFFVGVDSNWVADQRKAQQSSSDKMLIEQELKEDQKKNFGLKDLSILQGNIGYLSFNYFANPENGYHAMSLAMNFLERTDAIIIDLRSNNGGHMEMVQLLLSYFFSTENTQKLYSYYIIEDGKRIEKEDWVLPFVLGNRTPEKPIFVLTSTTTFSAAEWMAFILKDLNRATIIGQQTAGGAHPVDRKIIDDQFFLQVPIGELKGPVSEKDFEGIGVEPDIVVSSYNAKDIAHKKAIELLMTHAEDKSLYSWTMKHIDAQISPVTLTEDTIKKIIGVYEGRKIVYEDKAMYYYWGERGKLRLIPLSQTQFGLEGTDDFRFEVVFENDRVKGLKRTIYNGGSKFYKRIND